MWVYLYENFFDKYSICIFVLQIFKLNVGESLPVYLTYDEPDMLREHYVFYKTNRDTKYHVSEKFETLILLNEKNKDEYISLSRLW